MPDTILHQRILLYSNFLKVTLYKFLNPYALNKIFCIYQQSRDRDNIQKDEKIQTVKTNGFERDIKTKGWTETQRKNKFAEKTRIKGINILKRNKYREQSKGWIEGKQIEGKNIQQKGKERKNGNVCVPVFQEYFSCFLYLYFSFSLSLCHFIPF